MTTPISGMTGPETTAAEQSRMELQARLNGLGGLNGRQLNPEAKAKKLREACEGFESIFIQKMWQEMRNAVPKTGILTGREERFWQDMYDQELSKSMTKAGGIGLADMMYEQLSRNLVSASRSAAGVTQGAAFVPTAAPLIREEAEPESPLPQKLAASIYDGEASETGTIETVTEKAAPASQPKAEAAPQQPVATPQPLVAPQAPVKSVAEEAAKPERKHIRKADLGQSSGLVMAQKAKREAGDKLGSRAVRPSRNRAKEPVQEEPVAQPQTAGLNQAGNLRPGSPEALKAALELAKTGAAPAESGGTALNLNNIVANVQAMNTANGTVQAANPVTNAQAANTVAQAEEPVTKKVRFSTNIPKQANTSNKKTKDAIRMLNVDNTGVNSKQGKGLAAYHAQQAQVAPEPVTQVAQPAQAAIPPLTAKSQSETAANSGNFDIPPLTAAEARS